MMLNRSKVRVDRVAFSAAWLIVGLASLLAVVTVAPATADENHTYKRWGIIVAGELQQTGLADLVLAELSKEKGIELVERQQLDAALKELKLSAMLGSDAAGRLKLGRMLNADALVFMSLSKPEPSQTPKAREAGQEKQAEKPCLEMIVSDCVYGARLRVDHLKYDPGEVEKLAKRCASSVLQTQKRFTAGILSG